MGEREMTVAQTARTLGIAIGYVYALIWSGKLRAKKVNGQWRVSAEDVAARLKSRGE